jgi:hypothetical protein
MLYEIINTSVEDIKKGYSYNKDKKAFICNICEKEFPDDEIFKIGERYVKADKAGALHIEAEHGDMLSILCWDEEKGTGLTDNQKELLFKIASGLTDKEIAKEMGVSASTIRHQRFVFRQKVRQAKLLIAAYELSAESAKRAGAKPTNVKIHKNAKMVDERYNVSDNEREKILKTVFESLEPLKLKIFSAKEKKKLVALAKISECFEKDKVYKEKEVNEILLDIYHDYVTLRRYLIQYGFMERTKDCSEYWLVVK